jgi:hypothetical protein
LRLTPNNNPVKEIRLAVTISYIINESAIRLVYLYINKNLGYFDDEKKKLTTAFQILDGM